VLRPGRSLQGARRVGAFEHLRRAGHSHHDHDHLRELFQIIKLFPTGGGHLVASKLLSPTVGVVDAGNFKGMDEIEKLRQP